MSDTESAITFGDLGLSTPLLDALSDVGYETPSPIQAGAIPALLEGRDILGQAQTGTGKTAAFALPLLQRVDTSESHPQVLVLAPTRELAIQVAEACEKYSKHLSGLRTLSIYGGQGYDTQLRALRKGVQVIIGTPGRVMDHVRRGTLNLDKLQCLVLDEADEMLRMGFIDDVEWILQHTPPTRQIALFSATMPREIKTITERYLQNPVHVKIKSKTETASTIRQRVWEVRGLSKLQALTRLLEMHEHDAALIFVRTKTATEELAEQLNQSGFQAAALNGDIPQAQRERVVNRLKSGKLDVMVATDVAARGIDVNELTHVINVNIPDDPEVYVHRSGRTGRAGNSGISIVITHGRNMRKVKTLERIIGKTFEHKIVPSGDAICQIKMGEAIDELVAMEASTTLDPVLLDQAMDKLAHLSKAELIERFLDHETSAILSRYRGARDINETPGRAKEHGKRDNRTGVEAGYKTIVIDLGYRQKVNPSRLMGLINDQMPGQKVKIGKIDMDQSFSRIDIEERFAPEIAAKLQGAKTGSYVVNAYFEEGGAVSTPRRSNSHGGGDRREKRGSWGGNSDRGAKRSNWGGNSDRGERRSSWGGDSDRGERRGNWSGGDSDRPKRERVSSFGNDDRRNKSNSRAAGGSGYGGSRDGRYGGRSEGGRREGGYGSRSEGGYGGRSEGSRSEGGFSGRSESRGGAKKFKGTSKFKGAPKRRK